MFHLCASSSVKTEQLFAVVSFENVYFQWLKLSCCLQVFRCLPTDHVCNFKELREYNTTPNLATTNEEEALTHLAEVKGHLVLMPLMFLKDESLTPKMGQKEALLPSSLWTWFRCFHLDMCMREAWIKIVWVSWKRLYPPCGRCGWSWQIVQAVVPWSGAQTFFWWHEWVYFVLLLTGFIFSPDLSCCLKWTQMLSTLFLGGQSDWQIFFSQFFFFFFKDYCLKNRNGHDLSWKKGDLTGKETLLLRNCFCEIFHMELLQCIREAWHKQVISLKLAWLGIGRSAILEVREKGLKRWIEEINTNTYTKNPTLS